MASSRTIWHPDDASPPEPNRVSRCGTALAHRLVASPLSQEHDGPDLSGRAVSDGQLVARAHLGIDELVQGDGPVDDIRLALAGAVQELVQIGGCFRYQ